METLKLGDIALKQVKAAFNYLNEYCKNSDKLSDKLTIIDRISNHRPLESLTYRLKFMSGFGPVEITIKKIKRLFRKPIYSVKYIGADNKVLFITTSASIQDEFHVFAESPFASKLAWIEFYEHLQSLYSISAALDILFKD